MTKSKLKDDGTKLRDTCTILLCIFNEVVFWPKFIFDIHIVLYQL